MRLRTERRRVSPVAKPVLPRSIVFSLKNISQNKYLKVCDPGTSPKIPHRLTSVNFSVDGYESAQPDNSFVERDVSAFSHIRSGGLHHDCVFSNMDGVSWLDFRTSYDANLGTADGNGCKGWTVECFPQGAEPRSHEMRTCGILLARASGRGERRHDRRQQSAMLPNGGITSARNDLVRALR